MDDLNERFYLNGCELISEIYSFMDCAKAAAPIIPA